MITRRYCQKCDRWFERDSRMMVACGVMHPEGSCCHFHQRQIEPTETERLQVETDPLVILRVAQGIEERSLL